MDRNKKREAIIDAFLSQEEPRIDEKALYPFVGVRLIANKLQLSPSYVSKILYRYFGCISEKELLGIIGNNPTLKKELIKRNAVIVDKNVFDGLGSKKEKIWDDLKDKGFIGDNGEALDRLTDCYYPEELSIGDFVTKNEKMEIIHIFRQHNERGVLHRFGGSHYRVRMNTSCKWLIDRLKETDYCSKYVKELDNLLRLIQEKRASAGKKVILNVQKGRKPSLNNTSINIIIRKMNNKTPDDYGIDRNDWSAASFRKLVTILFPHIYVQPRRSQQIFNRQIKPYLV